MAAEPVPMPGHRMNSCTDAVTFPGTLDSLSPIRDYVKAAAEAAGLDHAAVYKLILAVDEIATNVITHGYEEAGLTGDISIEAASHDDSLVIQLTETGKPHDTHAHAEPADVKLFKALEDRPVGGLGIMLARDGVDDLQYESTERGNVHRFIMRLKPTSCHPCEPTL